MTDSFVPNLLGEPSSILTKRTIRLQGFLPPGLACVPQLPSGSPLPRAWKYSGTPSSAASRIRSMMRMS